jgi:hypothetical protein
LALCFIDFIPSNISVSSSLYPLAFFSCWWDLRRDSSFSYLRIILVLGVFQGLCGVWIINAIEKMAARFSVLKRLAERENDYTLIISLDSVNSLAFVEAYTPVQSPDS